MKQFLPALLLLIMGAVCLNKAANAQDATGKVSVDSVEEIDSDGFRPVDVDAEFPGGDPAWQKFLKRNLVYPKTAAKWKVQGTVIVQFILSKGGDVIDAWAIDGPAELWQSAIDVVKMSPKWIPTIEHGRCVKAYKKSLIEFKLDIKAKEGAEEEFFPVRFEGEFPGGDSAWQQFIKRNLVYPKEAIKKKIQGYVTVKFILNPHGTVIDAAPLDGPAELWQSATDVVCRSPKWFPAIQGGRQVKAYKKRVIEFKLDAIAQEDTLEQWDMIFVPVRQDGEFPGGDSAWQKFVTRKLVYPKKAAKKKIQGTVTVQFILGKDGTVLEAEAISGPDELRQSAIDVVMKSPKWIPAMQSGRQVKAYKKRDIVFKLETQ